MEIYHQVSLNSRANDLFWRAWRRCNRRLLVGFVLRQKRILPLLSEYYPNTEAVWTETNALQPVRLANIVGTQGSNLFDDAFLPRYRFMRPRWSSVALGMLGDAFTLPPIDVIQIGEIYFVSDGHHRVSVAKVLGKLSLDANIIRWHFRQK